MTKECLHDDELIFVNIGGLFFLADSDIIKVCEIHIPH